MKNFEQIAKEWDALYAEKKAQYERSLAALNGEAQPARERAHRLPRIGSKAYSSLASIA